METTTLLAIATALLLLWLLLQLLSRDEPQDDDIREQLRRLRQEQSQGGVDQQAEQQAKEEALGKLLKAAQSGNQEVSQVAKDGLRRLLKSARAGNRQWQDLDKDPALMQKLAERMTLEDILGYSEAIKLTLPEIQARQTSALERSLFPTLLTKVEPANDIQDVLLAGDPMQMYDRETTYRELARGELQVLTFWNEVVTDAILHLVVDVSNSMSDPMLSGLPKRILAKAVVYRLLTRSQMGLAKFLLRFFDGGVSTLKKAFTAEEVEALAKLVRDNDFYGSGTEILGAIQCAVADIEKESASNPNFVADIQLITDGQPNTPFTEPELKQILKKVRLHVIIIGDEDNEILKKVATSYKRMN